MAIKKKITYSVSYTAGTDTLSTKLNSLLQDIVTLILSQNTGLTVLDTITYGSSRMTGAPLFDGGAGGIYSSFFANKYYQSDLYFIGTSEDNICLSIGFYQGMLVIAMNMTPKVEKSITDVWSSRYGLENPVWYAVGRASRSVESNNYNGYNIAIPYQIYNDHISIDIIYWHTEYSSGYTYAGGDNDFERVSLVIFPTDEGQNQAGLGAAIQTFSVRSAVYHAGNLRGSLLAWSFSENLLDNPPDVIKSDTAAETMNSPVNTATLLAANGQYDARQWYAGLNNYGVLWGQGMRIWHTLGGTDGSMVDAGSYTAVCCRVVYTLQTIVEPGDTTRTPSGQVVTSYVTPLASAYNLPHLNAGQAYIRKMRIPGWNPECKGEIYLLWAPVLTAYQSGDIVEVGNKSYAIITEGAVCWAARVL